MSRSFVAGGTIRTSRFVKMQNTADKNHQVLECDAGELPIGISQRGPKAAPVSGASAIIAAVDQDQIMVNMEGDEGDDVLLLVDASTDILPGDTLKSDANGKGVKAGAGDKYGAVALETAKLAGNLDDGAGELIRVKIQNGENET